VPNLEHLRPADPDQPVILVAEDESVVRHIVRIALEAAGLFVLTAVDWEQALGLSRSFPGKIDALVSDVLMPNLDGVRLHEQILRERPGIKVLLMSGTGSHLPIKEVPFLRKPFQVEELKTRVRHLVGSAARSAL
jgi:DNA-binding NtrC family response regulator